MTAGNELTDEVRAKLAEYHVLVAYDLARCVRYGDMAGGRRGREINRRADALIDAGVPIDRSGHFPSSTDAELDAAFERVAMPRIRRIARESFRHNTRYTQATIAAWNVTRAKLLRPATFTGAGDRGSWEPEDVPGQSNDF